MDAEQQNKVCAEIYNQFSNAVSFRNNLGLIKEINRSVLFENGKQWNMDSDVAEYPKITLNLIKQIGKIRKSNIMQNEYGYLVNSTNFESIRKIQDFLKYQAMVVKMRQKDLKALNDDYSKGTAIGYFYWDAEKRGFMKNSGGEMRYEMIDIRNFAVANPYIQTIQDQEWVISATQEKINSLKAKYGADKNIVPDGNRYTGGTQIMPVAETNDEELVYVYTKFYRNFEGEVFFVIGTETTMLKEPTAYNPHYNGSDSQEQPNTTSLPDEKNKKNEDVRSGAIWNLYPFVRLCLNERDNCFYGSPIIMEYIEVQKSINNHFSVYDKALQDNVLGGFMFRKGVLESDEMVAENGNMIALDTMPNEPIGNAFARLPVANVPADSQNYSQNLIAAVRSIAGATNNQLGMADFSGQSGKQTQLLLQRAQENSSDNAMLFNEFKIDQAQIMFLFAKFFYDNQDFAIVEHGQKKDNVRSYKGENRFDGRQYLNDDVIIDIKVGAAPSFSEYSNMEMLGLMVQSGQAPLEVYINLLPDGFISNKQEIMELLENNSLKQIAQRDKQIEQQNMVIQQMVKAYEQTAKDRQNIDVVVAENDRLKSMLAEVSAKAIQKVADSTQQNTELTAEMQNILRIVNKQTK